MIIIPAIDIKEGRCVRLLQGKMEDQTIYSDNPVQMAQSWVAQGGQILHVVDLDGAVQGKPVNFETIRSILETVTVPVQVGGGLRDLDSMAAYLAAGASRIVLGTAAVQDRKLLEEACRQSPGRIIVAIDSREGQVAIRGWQEVSDQSAVQLARELQTLPIAGLLVTDIQRDGMLTGPNLPFLEEMVQASSIPVLASGGVRSLEDIRQLLKIQGLYGVIVGKALYEGLLPLEKAIAQTREGN